MAAHCYMRHRNNRHVLLCTCGNQPCVQWICRREFSHNFGTLTGTLSTGMVLLREMDPDFVTPASSNIVLQNIPSIAFLAPLLLSLGFAASSLTNTYIMFAVYLVLFLAYNIFLFRRKIFKKKYANKPEEEWTE